MKKLLLFILTQIIFSNLYGQISSGMATISETFSSNGRYKLISYSYDDDFPNTIGESFIIKYDIYKRPDTIYKIDRSFDLYADYPFHTIVSNDGKKIMHLINNRYYKGKENNNVVIYKNGTLDKSYTSEEFIKCNKSVENCELFYQNKYEVINYKKSSYLVKSFKENASEEDKFLYDKYIFNKNDSIYVTDSRKKTTIYDLNNEKFLKNNLNFDSIFPNIKNYITTNSKINYYEYPFKYIIDLETKLTNEKLSKKISDISGLKFIPLKDSTFNKFKLYRIDIRGFLDKTGKFELDSINADTIFDKQKIKTFLKETQFKTDFIPKEVDKIYLKNFFGGYRNYDNKIAEQVTINEKEKRIEEYKRRLTLEIIDGIYIPKNLYECMTELDSILNFESKRKLMESENLWEYNSHMGGLGMWIRNNWGINGGSRLKKYFNDRKVGISGFGNDNISGIIIEFYNKWLNGNKESIKKWEKNNPKKK
ncbi:DUF6794 domain-containing protein [Mangrovimonas cancribranchiae]|uniref:DUF6794 domain-containing protein n=1 Tax=Mangrovimonas cancribranchiae TaxID=3080055 RepID=A0AAU6P4F0_9FLAO